jgi:hypothetical protein
MGFRKNKKFKILRKEKSSYKYARRSGGSKSLSRSYARPWR